MKIRYVGPHKQIDYPVTAERGKTVEVPAALGRELVKQSTWEKAPVKKTEDKETHDG